MSKPTKVPGLPAIPSDASPDLKAYLKALGEALEVRLGRRGDERDRAITLRELIESGLAIKLKSKPFDPNRDVARDSLGISPINGPIVTVPPPPSNLVASGAFKNVILTWTDPNFLYGNHAYAEIFRQNAQAADPDGIALAQTMSGSGNLNLNGVLMTEDATNGTSVNSSVQFFQPTTVNITSAGNDSGRIFTVTGTNTSDGAVTDTITGANAGIATGDQIFKTVTQIAIDGAAAGNVSAGPAESVDAIGSATSILTSGAMTVTDSSGASGEAYFYWARFVSTSGIAGPFNKTAGTIASTVRIQETDISEDAITTPKLKAGSITADQGVFATAAIVSADIASAAITTAKINDAAIVAAKIGSAAITTAKIQDLAATTAKINDAAITTAKINDLSVDTLKIAGNAVTVPSGQVQASVVYSNTTVITSGSPTLITSACTFTTSAASSVIVNLFVQPLVYGSITRDSAITVAVQLLCTGQTTKTYTFDQVTNVVSGDDVAHQMVPQSLPFISISHVFTGVSAGSLSISAKYYGSRGFKNGVLSAIGAQR